MSSLIIAVLFLLYEEEKNIRDLYADIYLYGDIDDSNARLYFAHALFSLQLKGVTRYYFQHIRMKNFSFEYHKIKCINNSTFLEHPYFIGKEINFGTTLNYVDFSFIECKNVAFSREGGFGVTDIFNCTFWGTKLAGSKFCGSHIQTQIENIVKNKNDWFEEKDGALDRIYHPMFSGANLDGVDFSGATLLNVDFRDAEDVEKANFKGVSGLETCYFDDGVREKLKIS